MWFVIRFCCFYFTEKQDKKRDDFEDRNDYMKYVASIVEEGDYVKLLEDRYILGGIPIVHLCPGEIGTVVQGLLTSFIGRCWVKVKFDNLDDDVWVKCRNIEVLNWRVVRVKVWMKLFFVSLFWSWLILNIFYSL